MHIKSTHVTSTVIPDAVTTPLALHVIEDGSLAAPECGVSEGKKGIKIEVYTCNKEYMVTML